MPSWLKNILLVYISYLGFCLFFVQPVLNLAPAWFLDREYGRQLSAKILYLNPFTNALVAHEVALDNPDRSHFLKFRRAEVNLSLSSIWRSGWVLDRVQLSELDLAIKRSQEGAFNFDDFTAGAAPEEAAAEESGIPGITVHELDLSSRRIAYEDQAHEDGFSTHFDDLAVYVTDLSTVLVEGKPYSLTARGEAGGELYWEGLVSVPESSSEGKLRISDLSLAPAARFIAPWVNFDIPSAELTIEGDYSVNWGPDMTYRISQGQLTLADLALLPNEKSALKETRLSLGALAVSGIELSSQGQVTVAEVTLHSPVIEGWSEGEQVSLMTLLDTAALPAAEEDTEVVNGSQAGPSTEWTATIASMRIRDGELRWRSEYSAPATTEVTPINVELGAVNWPFAGSTPAQLSLRVNQKAELQLDGALELESGNGDFNFSLDKVFGQQYIVQHITSIGKVMSRFSIFWLNGLLKFKSIK